MPVKDSVSAAQFNRRIQIQAPVYTPSSDPEGGQATTWNTVYTCFADIQDFPHGRFLYRKFEYGQLYPQANTTIQIRYQKSVAIDATMRVLFPWEGVNHLFKILGVENPTRANVSMYLLCQEDQAQAPN